LSDYARKILVKAGIDFPEKRGAPMYRHEGKRVRDCLDYALPYLKKSGKKIAITYPDADGNLVAAQGQIVGIHNNVLQLRCVNGEYREIDISTAIIDLKSVTWS
jgi:hypothetical protein